MRGKKVIPLNSLTEIRQKWTNATKSKLKKEKCLCIFEKGKTNKWTVVNFPKMNSETVVKVLNEN